MNINDPQNWLLKADRDINLARLAQMHSPDASDLICYHCQQAGEKYLKALIVFHGIPLRKTHDLEELLDLLSPIEASINDVHYDEAIKIKIYAVGIRYPGGFGDPTEAEVLVAIAAAEFFHDFAKNIIGV